MYLVSIFGCLFNVLFIFTFVRIISRRLLFTIVILSISTSFLAALVVFYEVVILQTVCIVPLADWIQVSFLKVSWCLLFDRLSVVMLFVVLFISLLVHIYSLEYMSEDPHIVRFIFSLSLFTFFMLVMVTSNNILQLFFGWEGVGLSSYLLINFWYGRSEANKSAIKAIVVNRIGDFGLYLGILLIIFVFKSVNFGVVFATCHLYEQATLNIFGYDVGILTLIGCCIFLGTMGKSAQLGLHMWLPDAMEGPTPVSALLHAATMVTAGVFILIRFSVLFEYIPKVLFFITLIGSLTSLFAGVSAIFQTDIKKIIAYSTCSHLGIMLTICGFSQYDVAVFHLLNHAFFKALLFLGAGSVIHALGDEQDFRKMGGLVYLLPLTYTMFLVGSLSLSGFPFLSGYFSKDLIWELLFTNYYTYNSSSSLDLWLCSSGISPFLYYKYMFFVFNIVLALSVLYSARLVILIFSRGYSGYLKPLGMVHEPSFRMLVPIVVLALFSIFAGYVFRDLFVGLGVSNRSVAFESFKEIIFSSDIRNWPSFVLKTFTFFLSTAIFISVLYYYSRVSPILVFLSWHINNCILSFLLFPFFFICYYIRHKVIRFFIITIFVVSSLIIFTKTSIFLIVWLLFTLPPITYGSTHFVNLPTLIMRLFSARSYKRFVLHLLSHDHVFYKGLTRLFTFVSYHVTFKSIDRGFLEFFGPFGITKTMRSLIQNLSLRFSTHFFSSLFLVVICIFLIGLGLFASSFDDLVFLIFLVLASSFLIN